MPRIRANNGRFIHKGENPNIIYQDENWLRDNYVKGKRSIQDISKECHVHHDTVRKWLKRYNIELRKNNYRFYTKENILPYRKPDWLHNEYVNKKRPLSDIAREFDVNISVIHRFMKKFGFERRNQSECRTGELNWRFKGGHTERGGYKYVYDGELAKKLDYYAKGNGFYVKEHVKVMCDHLGRLLKKEEVVHHKDGDKHNNKIENLELFSCNGDHIKHEHRLNKFAKKLLYGDLTSKSERKKLQSIFKNFIKEQD